MKVRRVLLPAMAMASAVTFALGGVARAQTYDHMEVQGTGYCLGNYNDVDQNGNGIVLWQCLPGDAQSWALVQVYGAVYEIQNTDGKCLSDPWDTGTDGVELELYTCNSSDDYDLWLPGLAPDGYLTYENANISLDVCLGDYNDFLGNGNAIVVWSCIPTSNDQQWSGP